VPAKDGTEVTADHGLKRLGREAGTAVFEIPSGAYSFQSVL
jgi:hypothetical protein